MPSLSQRLIARTKDRSPSHPANNTVAIDTSTLNGRVQYAFGTIINTKMPEGVKETKLAKGFKMLWPHMSKDMAKAPEKDLYRAAGFIDVILQLCIAGVPEGFDMSFEEYMDGVFAGTVHILPGRATIIEDTSVTA